MLFEIGGGQDRHVDACRDITSGSCWMARSNPHNDEVSRIAARVLKVSGLHLIRDPHTLEAAWRNKRRLRRSSRIRMAMVLR
jgi:hypothetical protein